MTMHVLCFTDMDNEKLGRISRGLDAQLNVIIGAKVLVNVRRTTTNLRDHLSRIDSDLANSDRVPVYSGSKAEGLRFKSSDEDWMSIYRDIKVIPSDSFTTIYDSNTTLLLMENEMTKPGFTLLKLVGKSTNPAVTKSIEHNLNGPYLSCKRWRELHTTQSEFTHGPCASTTIGPCEYDFAYCLRCDIWPANAQDCIGRLHQCGWPSHNTILGIVNDGVLFVPIGAKQSVFEDTEWRMSFSLAEKRLIHAMNHTQFLCYGLLKLFLKEAIDVNPNVKGLLCSYFLKTALFWEITTTSVKWSPSTLLSGFWNCFRRLLQWISCSYCPNFFTPENNMFGGKIEGQNRDELLKHLRTLYYEGYSCLLRCQSLAYTMSLIKQGNVELQQAEVDKIVIALEIMQELIQCKNFFIVENLWMYRLVSPTNSHERFLLKAWLHQDLSNMSICGNKFNATQDVCNKSNYQNLTERINILGRCRTDSAAYLLYQAMLCYNSERCNHALRLIQQCKEKISDPRAIIFHNATVTEKKLEEAGFGHLPIETVLKKHFIGIVKIEKDQNIPELYLEMHSLGTNYAKTQFFTPPLICVFLLQYLCQRKVGNLREADDILYELSLLVQYDDGHHIYHRAISWQILGICQQMSGHDWAACRSFLRAQQQLGGNLFKVASCTRLGIILLKYF